MPTYYFVKTISYHAEIEAETIEEARDELEEMTIIDDEIWNDGDDAEWELENIRPD